MSNNKPRTSPDTSVSSTQHQDADGQLVITNDTLRGEMSTRALIERRYDNDKHDKTIFTAFPLRRSVRGLKAKYGDSFMLGYALVDPGVNTKHVDTKHELFSQFGEKDNAYVWRKSQPTHVPPSRMTVRFIVEYYHTSYSSPSKSGWAGRYHVESSGALVGNGGKYRIAGVAEVPRGTSFPRPFGKLSTLRNSLEKNAFEYELNPDFRRVA